MTPGFDPWVPHGEKGELTHRLPSHVHTPPLSQSGYFESGYCESFDFSFEPRKPQYSHPFDPWGLCSSILHRHQHQHILKYLVRNDAVSVYTCTHSPVLLKSPVDRVQQIPCKSLITCTCSKPRKEGRQWLSSKAGGDLELVERWPLLQAVPAHHSCRLSLGWQCNCLKLSGNFSSQILSV